MGGGSSPGGTSAWPAYMQDAHEDMVNDMATALVPVAKANNPYEGVNAYQPDDYLGDMQTRLDSWDTIVTALDERTDWAAMVTEAISGVEDAITSDDYIQGVVDRREQEMAGNYARAVNRLTGGMADLNATNSSAFILGLALVEQDRLAELAGFREKLELSAHSDRTSFIQNAVSEMTRQLVGKIDAQRLATYGQLEVSRMSIAAMTQTHDQEVVFRESETMWPFTVYQQLNNTLASVSGAIAKPDKMSVKESVLSGALSGATAGATLGSMTMPGAGTAVMSAIGLGVGAWLGYSGGK